MGKTLFDDGVIELNEELLIGLIHALMLLGESLGPSKGLLREAELGNIQLSLLAKDKLVYAVLHSSLDNESFIRKQLDGVIDEFHGKFLTHNIYKQFEDEVEIRERISELLHSMKFPSELLDETQKLIDEFNTNVNYAVDTLLLTDLDDGLIRTFQGDNEHLIKALLEILSELNFEQHWVGESKLLTPVNVKGEERSHEVCVLYRCGLTDFVLVGRAYYKPGFERERLIEEFEKLSERIQELFLNHK